MKGTRIAVALLALGLMAGVVCAEEPPVIVRDPMKLAAPEVAWAKPDRAPPIRALVIAPMVARRDVYDLAAHLNMTFDKIETYNHEQMNFAPDPMGRMDRPDLEKTETRVVPASAWHVSEVTTTRRAR